MNITLEDRMQNVEDELKQLRKEMEESIARYKAVDAVGKSYPFTHGDVSKFRSVEIGDTEEAVDFIPMTAEQWRDYLSKSWENFKIDEQPPISYDYPEFKLWGMEQKCIWDSIPVEDRMKPMGLSCPCRMCSAYC